VEAHTFLLLVSQKSILKNISYVCLSIHPVCIMSIAPTDDVPGHQQELSRCKRQFLDHRYRFPKRPSSGTQGRGEKEKMNLSDNAAGVLDHHVELHDGIPDLLQISSFSAAALRVLEDANDETEVVPATRDLFGE
jgi:hypothetical protein